MSGVERRDGTWQCGTDAKRSLAVIHHAAQERRAMRSISAGAIS
jgi:hypothetical protein